MTSFQPMHDLHGTVVLLRSHRTEPELRHRHLVRQHLLRRAHDVERPRPFVPINGEQRRFLRRRPVRACSAASPACPSMKTKAGTCCTWASPADGGMERPISAARHSPATSFSCGPGPNCATTIPAGSPAGTAQLIPNSNSNRMVDTGSNRIATTNICWASNRCISGGLSRCRPSMDGTS